MLVSGDLMRILLQTLSKTHKKLHRLVLFSLLNVSLELVTNRIGYK